MTKQDIINAIPEDWYYTENNGFVHIKDAKGNIVDRKSTDGHIPYKQALEE